MTEIKKSDHDTILPSLAGRLAPALMLFAAAACSGPQDEMSVPFKAQVLVGKESANPIDPPQSVLKTESFRYLSSLDEMDGTYFKVLSGGRLRLQNIEGSQVSQPDFSGGSSPDLRYRVDSGIVVPKDYSSLAILSSYWLLEEVISKLESFTGVKPEEFLRQNGKMDVLFEPTIVLETDALTAEVMLKLNAAYVPSYKKFVLFRRSAVEKQPLAMNLQVIAHEFGHALFEMSFFNNAFKENDRFAQDEVLKGINEGYADLVSWAVTGSANVLRNSLDFDVLANPRNFAQPNFIYESLTSPGLFAPESRCNGGIYCVGTLFAHGVFRSHIVINAGSNAQELRHETLRLVYQSLLGAQARMKEEPVIYPRNGSADGQKSLSAFLRAFIQGMPDQWQSNLCTSFDLIFRKSGFSDAAREGVCS